MSKVPTTGELSIVIEMPEHVGGELPSATASPGAPQDVSEPSFNPVIGGKNGQVKLALAVSAAKNIVMQGINAAVSNIGLATGNTYQQAKIERGLQAGQSIFNLAFTFAQNPIAGAFTVAGMGIQAAAETYRQNKEREIANYQAEQYAKRIGYTVDRR